eukprot:COSAG01_NODE_1328_length_10708_cov_102.064379_13_plen_97_part_00
MRVATGDLGTSVFSATVMLFSGWDTDQLADALSPTLATCHYLVYVIFVPLVMLNLLVRCLRAECAPVLSGIECCSRADVRRVLIPGSPDRADGRVL